MGNLRGVIIGHTTTIAGYTQYRRTGKVGSGFVRARSGARGLPSRDIDSLEVFCHLSDLNGVEAIQISVKRQFRHLPKTKMTHAPYVCDGVPFLNRADRIAHSFLANRLDGYEMGIVPRLDTT